MSAILRFLDTDGSTVITTDDDGNIASPGSSAGKKVYVENFGDQTAQSVTVDIEAVGTNDGDDYAQSSLDSGGSPAGYGTAQLSLGNITAGNKVAFWFREVLSSGVTADGNPRRYNLTATATTI